MHFRSQIRAALADLLTGLSTIEARVYPSNIWPIDDANLPCITIQTPKDDVKDSTLTGPYGRTYIRELTILISVKVKAASNYEQTADSVAAQIEEAIEIDPTLGGLCKPITLDQTETRLSREGDKPIAVCDLTYYVVYSHRANDSTGLVN